MSLKVAELEYVGQPKNRNKERKSPKRKDTFCGFFYADGLAM